MSDNIRTALYAAEYSATLASRRSTAPPVLARVVGKHCEGGDILVRDEFLPADIAAGDLLAVPGSAPTAGPWRATTTMSPTASHRSSRWSDHHTDPARNNRRLAGIGCRMTGGRRVERCSRGRSAGGMTDQRLSVPAAATKTAAT